MNVSLKTLKWLLYTVLAIASTGCAGQTTDKPANELELAISAATKSDTVKAGLLNLTTHKEMREQALRFPSTIAGFPFSQKPRILTQSEEAQARDILLQPDRYFYAQIRCKNSKIVGYRFTMKDQKIEVAVTSPCNQVFWAYEQNDEVKIHGAMLSDDDVAELFSIATTRD